VINYGTIGTVTLGGGNNDLMVNAGRINGNVQLGGGTGQVFDSTNGTIYNVGNANGIGTVTAGGGGDTIVGALNGGSLIGGLGNDVLIANQSTSSDLNFAAKVVMDGKGGVNAMYGGTGTNVFMSGDAAYNQIWGGTRDNAGVSPNCNFFNTVDYSQVATGTSVYVDLLNGHDAYTITNGMYTYEDSIQNVPNVNGTAGNDIIQCDNGTDIIKGGPGADQLYAGTGNFRGSDTFVYTQYADSNLMNGYDTIVGFTSGTDKIDASALHLTPASVAISTNSTSTVLYLEMSPGTFNANTDLAIAFTKANALQASDIIL
jgi:Ca2+-binding RTX toxin-like protein